jgi:hypothetical protein
MSTIGYESWAVDLKDVGAVYPFQGSETLLVIIGVVLWIGWHVIQTRGENGEMADEARHATNEDTAANIDRY